MSPLYTAKHWNRNCSARPPQEDEKRLPARKSIAEKLGGSLWHRKGKHLSTRCTCMCAHDYAYKIFCNKRAAPSLPRERARVCVRKPASNISDNESAPCYLTTQLVSATSSLHNTTLAPQILLCSGGAITSILQCAMVLGGWGVIRKYRLDQRRHPACVAALACAVENQAQRAATYFFYAAGGRAAEERRAQVECAGV